MPYTHGTGTVVAQGGDCGRSAGTYLKSNDWPKFTEELRQKTTGQTIVCSMIYPLKAHIAKAINKKELQACRDQVDNMIKAGWILGALCPGNHTGDWGGSFGNPYYMAIMILILRPKLKERLDALEAEYEKTVIQKAEPAITTVVKPERRKRYIINGRIRYLTDTQFAQERV